MSLCSNLASKLKKKYSFKVNCTIEFSGINRKKKQAFCGICRIADVPSAAKPVVAHRPVAHRPGIPVPEPERDFAKFDSRSSTEI